MLQLDEKGLQPLLSEYLAHGFREDEIVLESVRFEPACVQGTFRVVNAYMPTDGQFHLSATMIFNCISQLGIAYACLDQNLTRKTGEVYLADLSLQCRKPIRERVFTLTIHLEERTVRTSAIRYQVRFTADNDAFVGKATFTFPIAKATIQ